MCVRAYRGCMNQSASELSAPPLPPCAVSSPATHVANVAVEICIILYINCYASWAFLSERRGCVPKRARLCLHLVIIDGAYTHTRTHTHAHTHTHTRRCSGGFAHRSSLRESRKASLIRAKKPPAAAQRPRKCAYIINASACDCCSR